MCDGDDHGGIGGGHENLAADHAARVAEFVRVWQAQGDAGISGIFRRQAQVADPRREGGVEQSADGGFVHEFGFDGVGLADVLVASFVRLPGPQRVRVSCVRHDNGS